MSLLKLVLSSLIFTLFADVASAATVTYVAGCRFDDGREETKVVSYVDEVTTYSSLSGRTIRVTASQLGWENKYDVQLLVEEVSSDQPCQKGEVILDTRVNEVQAGRLGQGVAEIRVKVDQGLYDTMYCGLFVKQP